MLSDAELCRNIPLSMDRHAVQTCARNFRFTKTITSVTRCQRQI